MREFFSILSVCTIALIEAYKPLNMGQDHASRFNPWSILAKVCPYMVVDELPQGRTLQKACATQIASRVVSNPVVAAAAIYKARNGAGKRWADLGRCVR